MIGASSRSRWFIGCSLAAQAADAEAAVGAGAAVRRRRLGLLLDLEDRALGEQVGAQVLVELGSWRRSHSSVIAACSFSSSRLCARIAASSASSVASTRWSYQSTASSSSMIDTIAAVAVDTPVQQVIALV